MKIQFQLRNQLTELCSLHERLKELETTWHFPKRVCLEINLILDELVTNIINYGDRDNDASIDVTIKKTEDKLTIQVTDDGPPFDPTKCTAPDTTTKLAVRQCGGLGIHLVRKFSDSCSYNRIENQNIFRLEKTIPEECR